MEAFDLEKFIERVEGLLRKNGIQKKQFCEDLHIAINSFSNWRAGHAPFDSSIYKIASYFGVSPEYLTGASDDDTPVQKESPPSLTESEQALLELFRMVPEQDQQLVLNMIRVALSKQ